MCYLRIIVKQEVALIAVRFDPNVDLIVSLLAILKAGFSYLPIAPDWPKERIEYLLADSNPLAILTNKEDYKNEEAEIIFFDTLVTSSCCETNLNFDEMYHDNVAETYAVMYTSGSSGLPKGSYLLTYKLIH